MNREELVLTLRLRYVMDMYKGVNITLIINDIRRCCEKISYQKVYGFSLYAACPHPCTYESSCQKCWEETINKFLNDGDVDVSL